MSSMWCSWTENRVSLFLVALWGSTFNKKSIPNKDTRYFRDFSYVIIIVIWPHRQLESNDSFVRQFLSAVNETWIYLGL